MITDPISDLLARIRNAQAVCKPEVTLAFSRIKFEIAKILEREGYVGSVEQVPDGSRTLLRIPLKYEHRRPAIHFLRRVSRPSRRIYAKTTELPRVQSDLGIAIVSTPSGVMTNKEARARRLGGEVICEIA
ncbi:MAG TPA: 30S ribosomal protein S8 [Patescibacteria group bacterium]|nr:30S ribosomal protein S8 [Patescibacteria group bacterium]